MKPNGVQRTAESAGYRVQVATANNLTELVRMQMALQESTAGVGTHLLHLNRSSTVRLYDYYRQQIDDAQARLLVACEVPSEAVVGMGSARIWMHAEYVPARSGELIDLWVDPDHRRRGLAGRIVSGLLKFFKANRVEFLSLNYVAGDSASEALWKRLGFRPMLVTATAERRTAEAILDKPSQRIIPVGYRATTSPRPVHTAVSLLG